MRFLPAQILAWRAGLCLAAAGPGGLVVSLAQSPTLESLKKGHEEEVEKTVLPLREGYRKALLALETQLGAKGDYVGARRVQQERREMDRLTGRNAAAGSLQAGRVEPGSGVAKLGLFGESGGGVRAEAGSWTGWQAAGGFVRWGLPAGLRGGGYLLDVLYASAGDGSLPLAVREDFHVLNRVVKVAAAPLDGVPQGRFRLGTLRLRPGATQLELKLTAPGSVADFRLFEIQLIPEEPRP